MPNCLTAAKAIPSTATARTTTGADCYNQAADKCDGPYEIVSTNTVGVGNTPMRNIIVKCKK